MSGPWILALACLLWHKFSRQIATNKKQHQFQMAWLIESISPRLLEKEGQVDDTMNWQSVTQGQKL